MCYRNIGYMLFGLQEFKKEKLRKNEKKTILQRKMVPYKTVLLKQNDNNMT